LDPNIAPITAAALTGSPAPPFWDINVGMPSRQGGIEAMIGKINVAAG
jgi:hypothetical protein